MDALDDLDLFKRVKAFVLEGDYCSVSQLQVEFDIAYMQARVIIQELMRRRIVGAPEGGMFPVRQEKKE